jgi:hypothetical protein
MRSVSDISCPVLEIFPRFLWYHPPSIHALTQTYHFLLTMPPKDPKTTAAKRKNTDETAEPTKKRGRPTKKNPPANALEGSNNNNGRKDAQIDPSSLAEDEAAAEEEDEESDEGEPENRKGKAKATPKGPRAIKKTFLDLLSEQMDRVTTLHKVSLTMFPALNSRD